MPTVQPWRPLICSTVLMALAACGEPRDTAAGPVKRAAEVMAVAAPAAQPESTPTRRAERAATAAELPRASPAPSARLHAAYQRDEAGWSPILFLCDGVDGDRVQLITTPDAKGGSMLRTYAKPGFGTRREIVRVGNQDAGAGSVWWPLLDPGGQEVGSVRSLNPGMIEEGGAGLPTLSSIRAHGAVTRCRRLDRAQLMLITPARTVVVTREPGGYRYSSFDHAKPGRVTESGPSVSSQPTLSVGGGQLAATERNHERYAFRNGPWTYRLDASADNRAPGASLTMLMDGRVVQTATASAYQMAAKRIE